MKKYVGFGGVGDCFIVLLKLLELDHQYYYTHAECVKEKVQYTYDLLKFMKINGESRFIHTTTKNFFHRYGSRYDKAFNVAYNGIISKTKQKFHWAPYDDDGIKNPFNNYRIPIKKIDDIDIVTQVNAGPAKTKRTYTKMPIVNVTKKIAKGRDITWVGTEKFNSNLGNNLTQKQTFEDVMYTVANAKTFIGYNSVLLYWALFNRVKCYLLMDEQKYNDVRIHKDWLPYLTYLDGDKI